MPLAPDAKKTIIDEYATHPGDTGSPEVQVAMLTVAAMASASCRSRYSVREASGIS